MSVSLKDNILVVALSPLKICEKTRDNEYWNRGGSIWASESFSFTGRVNEPWHRLPKEDGVSWMWSWITCFRWFCLSGELDQMPSNWRSPFQLAPFYDNFTRVFWSLVWCNSALQNFRQQINFKKPARVLVVFSGLAWALKQSIGNLVAGIQVISHTTGCTRCWSRLPVEDWWCLSEGILSFRRS